MIAEANVPVADPFASAASSGAFGSWRWALGFPCLGNEFQIHAGLLHFTAVAFLLPFFIQPAIYQLCQPRDFGEIPVSSFQALSRFFPGASAE